MHSRQQYLEHVRQEYQKAASKKEKSRLLNEAARRTGMARKYLIRKLNGAAPVRRKKKRQRRRRYGASVQTALVKVWEIFDYPCGQRLVPALRRELERLRDWGEVRCSKADAQKLQEISPKTIDRLVAGERRVLRLQRNRHAPVHPLLYQKIPVKVADEWDREEVGNLQLDYVAHCGRSATGEYIHTLSAAEIAAGWWEGEAIAGRSQKATRDGLEQIRQRLPFRVREIHPDNDSGMINDLVYRYCVEKGIAMSRSRPYQKNDNAWVEQRNWSHVRKVVGYYRYDTTSELRLLNELYRDLSLYKNFFQPTIKLREKTRVGGKVKRVYDEPRTPYQRLVESGQLNRRKKGELRKLYESLNPAELRRRIETARERMFRLCEQKAERQRGGE